MTGIALVYKRTLSARPGSVGLLYAGSKERNVIKAAVRQYGWCFDPQTSRSFVGAAVGTCQATPTTIMQRLDRKILGFQSKGPPLVLARPHISLQLRVSLFFYND